MSRSLFEKILTVLKYPISSVKAIGLLAIEKKIFRGFYYYWHSYYVGHVTWIILTNF